MEVELEAKRDIEKDIPRTMSSNITEVSLRYKRGQIYFYRKRKLHSETFCTHTLTSIQKLGILKGWIWSYTCSWNILTMKNYVFGDCTTLCIIRTGDWFARKILQSWFLWLNLEGQRFTMQNLNFTRNWQNTRCLSWDFSLNTTSQCSFTSVQLT